MQITAGDGPGPSLLPVPGLCFISHTRLPHEQVSLRSPSAVCEFCTWHRGSGEAVPLAMPLGSAGGSLWGKQGDVPAGCARACQQPRMCQDVPVAQDVTGCASRMCQQPRTCPKGLCSRPRQGQAPLGICHMGSQFQNLYCFVRFSVNI